MRPDQSSAAHLPAIATTGLLVAGLFLAVLVLVPQPTQAAQVAVTDISTGSADANQLDITHIVVSGDDLLVVGVLLEVTAVDKEVLSVTWDPGVADEALTRFTAFSPGHGKLRLEVWQLTNPAVKTATMRITIENGASQKMGATCVSLTNVNTTTPLEGPVTQGGAGSSGSVSVTQEADDLAFVFTGHQQSADPFSPGGGEAEHADFAAIVQRMWASSEDGSGATTMSWTQATSRERSTLGFNINASVTAAWCDAVTVVTSDPAGQLWFNETVEPDGLPFTTQLNVSASFQDGTTPALNVTNDGTGPCDISIRLVTDPGTGRSLKFNTTNSAPWPADPSKEVPLEPSSVTGCTGVAPEGTCDIWLWADYENALGGQSVPKVRVESQ